MRGMPLTSRFVPSRSCPLGYEKPSVRKEGHAPWPLEPRGHLHDAKGRLLALDAIHCNILARSDGIGAYARGNQNGNADKRRQR